jgi:hypothetical protein
MENGRVGRALRCGVHEIGQQRARLPVLNQHQLPCCKVHLQEDRIRHVGLNRCAEPPVGVALGQQDSRRVARDRNRDRLLRNLPNLAQRVVRRAIGSVVVNCALIVAQHMDLRADQ